MIWRAALLLFLLGAAQPRLAGAQPAPAAQARPRAVLLDDAASMPASFRETLGELLGRLSLTLAPAAGEARALARVRVEPRASGLAVVIFRGDGSLFVQREIAPSESSALQSETVAHVILGAIEALAAEPEAPAPKPEPPPPEPPPPEPAKSEPAKSEADPREGARLVLGARGLLQRPLAWVPGGALRVGLGAPWKLRPQLFAEGSLLRPFDVYRRAYEASVGFTSLRGGVQIDALGGADRALTVAARGGFDRVRLATLEAPPFVQSPSSTRWQPTLGLAAGGRFRMLSGLALTLEAGADLDLAPRRWMIQLGPEREELFKPDQARLFASLGVELSLSLPGGSP